MRMSDEQAMTVGLKDTLAWFLTLWPSYIKAVRTLLRIQVQKKTHFRPDWYSCRVSVSRPWIRRQVLVVILLNVV